jgi:hypothetical protein
VENPNSLVKTHSLMYSRSFKCWEVVQYGEGMTWSTALHKAFPAEFRAAVRELMLLFRTGNNPLGRAMTRDLIFYIVKLLAKTYCSTSPLDRWVLPDIKADKEDENQEIF